MSAAVHAVTQTVSPQRRAVISQDQLVGGRIKALSELTGVSRTRLAEGVGATPAMLSKVAGGNQRFPLELASALAESNLVPLDFFVQTDPTVEVVVPTFRKKARASATEQKRIVRLTREAARVFTRASVETDYRPFDFADDADLLEDVEQVAIEVRRAARIEPDVPVPNVTRVLERQGIAVINGLDPYDDHEADFTGVSLPTAYNRRPLIAVIGHTPGAVARFTIAHEAAHCIWDLDLPSPLTSTRDHRELRAHRFAGALLLPEAAMRQRIHEHTTLRGYLPVKADYGVSVGAIIMRARDLRIITSERARSLQIQLSSLGWRDPAIEPVPVSDERPLLLKQALQRATATDNLSLAAYTGLPPELVRHWAQLDPEPQPDAVTADVIDLAAARERRSNSPVPRPERLRR